MPPCAVYVGRPTKWGNLLGLGEVVWWHGREFAGTSRAELVAFYREWIVEQFTLEELRRDLGGRDLACWCPLGEPCHADVLLELANQ